MLSRTRSGLEGRWFYEQKGNLEGLVLHGVTEPQDRSYELTEALSTGEITGKILLHEEGSTLRGEWTTPTGARTLPVTLSPEIRAREGDNVVRAKRIMVKYAGPPALIAAGFLPVIDGPAARQMTPNLTLQKLAGDDEKTLDGCCTTNVAFEVLHHDSRVVTIATAVSTLGAYPSSHGSTLSLRWATGARVGAEIFRPERKRELVRLLNARVHDAWRAKKRELSKGPTDTTSCGPDVIDAFMTGDGPSFVEAMLSSVYVHAKGIAFAFDFGFPHVVHACSPVVELELSWVDADPYLGTTGAPLH